MIPAMIPAMSYDSAARWRIIQPNLSMNASELPDCSFCDLRMRSSNQITAEINSCASDLRRTLAQGWRHIVLEPSQEVSPYGRATSVPLARGSHILVKSSFFKAFPLFAQLNFMLNTYIFVINRIFNNSFVIVTIQRALALPFSHKSKSYKNVLTIL